jgi:N-acetylmuramoyl-L-alanine amidase
MTRSQFDTLTAALSPAETMALTALRESESRLEKGRWIPNPFDAHLDILEVIDTRAKDRRWAHLGHKGVCLAPWQFSCWKLGGGADNYFRLLKQAQQLLTDDPKIPMRLAQLVAAAEGCLAGALVHTLDGATHYHADTLAPFPAWTAGARRTEARYGHIFYAGVR